ncbi:ORF6C domain-containing protein [Oscillochloris sp. ZM17-4]|uniref:phage antirepressor N-terminal domain-containing protein n=1 Tax=Oscillochloris sp. ZM17-4 TaxID=2866714 RepID=UPI001C73C8E3|nr:ORF6C domain-containing protein [Oscillochloris sp. ZM17-4]
MSDSLARRIVPFYGDDLIAVQHPSGSIYVLFAKVCENLGLARRGQVLRVQRHAVLSRGLELLHVETEGGTQTLQCLRLDLLPLWLSGVQASRVRAELQDKLVQYQAEAAEALWREFRPQIIVAEAHAPAPDTAAVVQLQQIAEMGRAITAMAEQQIEIQRQQQLLAERLNKAGQVVRGMQGSIQNLQGDVRDIQVRLGVLEDRIHPASYITEAQASEVSNIVKALAELLAGKDRAKNHYQGIFGELYRRFGVASYRMIHMEQYDAVLAFLERWRAAGTVESPGVA